MAIRNQVGTPLLTGYNVIAGGDPAQYPPNNFFPSSLDDVRFMNHHSGNYQLVSSSRYKRAGSDGKDLGVDYDSLCASMPVALQPKLYCTSNSPPAKGK